MKKQIIFILLFFFSIYLCGCLQDEKPSNEGPPIIDWEVIGCNRIVEAINHSFKDSENNTHYVETEGISNVSITLKNTGNIVTTYVIDIQFETRVIDEWIDVGYGIIWSINKCPCDSISDSDNVYKNDQKIITLDPDQIGTVYSSCNPNPSYGLRVSRWCYEISYN